MCCTATVRLAFAAVVLFLGVSVAASAAPTARPACVVQGKPWRDYDVPPGKDPILIGTGNLYTVAVINVRCAFAKAALAKMFPWMTRANWTGSRYMKVGPKGYTCRTQNAIRPDVTFGGECAGLSSRKLFSWALYDPKHSP